MALPTAKFPGAIASVADLRQQVDATPSLLQAPPTLAASLNATDTSFSVATGKGSQLPTDNFVVSIDDEIIFVGSRSGDTLSSCVRGVDGTTASAHGSGVAVYANVVAAHHNQLASEVVALETYAALVKLGTATPSGSSANLDFTSLMSSAYDEYLIEIHNIRPTSTGAIDVFLQFSTNNGSSFDTTTSNYVSGQYALRLNGAGNAANAGITTKAGVSLWATGIHQNQPGISFTIKIFNQSGVYKNTMSQANALVNDGSYWSEWGSGFWFSTTQANAIRITNSGPTNWAAAGYAILYGVKK